LEDHRDVTVTRRQPVDDPIADPDLAFRDLLETGDHPERRRLPAARRADENHELAVLGLQRQVGNGPRTVRKNLCDI
jgi:hypothetical protein